MSGPLVVCDTNVAVTANGDAPQAGDGCRLACIERIEAIMRYGRLALDDHGVILGEYVKQRPYGWPRSVGDLFIIWAVTNQANPLACRTVPITPLAGPRVFWEFPDDQDLAGFDADDRVFVATSIACDEHPPILNATDTDYRDFHEPLERHGVEVSFLCPDLMTSSRDARL
jgi:hypothetical protein